MTHAETILEKLAEWKPTGPGPHHLRLELTGGSVLDLSAEQTDAFSLLLQELSVVTGPVESCAAAELTQRAVDLAQRITIEPLKVYEVDAGQCKALLRSATPTQRAGNLSYYELTLTGRYGAGLKRYRVAKGGGSRSAQAFPLTHEAVAKVVDEIVGES